MNTAYNRYNVRVNSQHRLFKNFTLGENFMVAINDRRSAETRGDYDGVISSALFNMRNIPVWEDEAAEIYGTPSGDFPNPVASLNSRHYRTKNLHPRYHVSDANHLFDFLTYKPDFGY